MATSAHQSDLIVNHRHFDESDYSGLQVAPTNSHAEKGAASAPEAYDPGAFHSQGQGTADAQHNKSSEKPPAYTTHQSAAVAHGAGLEAVHPTPGDLESGISPLDARRGRKETYGKKWACCGLSRKTVCILTTVVVLLMIIGVGLGVGLGLGLSKNNSSPKANSTADSTADSDSSGVCPKYDDGDSHQFFDPADDTIAYGRYYNITCGYDAAAAYNGTGPGSSSQVTADFKACIFECDQKSDCFMFAYNFPNHNCTLLDYEAVPVSPEDWPADSHVASGWT